MLKMLKILLNYLHFMMLFVQVEVIQILQLQPYPLLIELRAIFLILYHFSHLFFLLYIYCPFLKSRQLEDDGVYKLQILETYFEENFPIFLSKFFYFFSSFWGTSFASFFFESKLTWLYYVQIWRISKPEETHNIM